MLHDARENNSPVSRTILLGLAFAAPILALALLRTNIWIAFAPLVVSHLLQLYATVAPNSGWWGPVMSKFATNEREVWITIDDGPTVNTLKILDVLAAFDVRATFFVVGQRAENHPRLITEILARGHELANHTYTHPSGTFWLSGPRRILREIVRGAEFLRSAPSRPAKFFRAPAGMKNPFVHPILRQHGLNLIGWSVRGFDTSRRDARKVAAAIAKQTEPGAIILLHDRHRKRNPEFYARCLEQTLRALSDNGYRCVLPTIAQLGGEN